MRSIIVGSVAAAIVLVAAGCASPGADAPSAPGSPASLADLPTPSPAGEVLAVATVLEQGGGAILCVGPVAESAPPQCGGPELLGWDWDAFEHQVTGGVRWVQGVAITGVYEAATDAFTQTGEPMSAAAITLPAIEVPSGELDEATIESVEQELLALERPDVLGVGGQDGIVVLNVVYDDGSMQAALDEVYGPGTVFVVSALRDAGGPGADAPELVDPPMDTAAPVITGAEAQARLAELPTPLPAGGVWAAGLALDRPEGDVLCLGDVGASAPPVCSGVPLTGFDWTVLPLDEAQGVRWADALVSGSWDGEVFDMTSPPQPLDAWSPPSVEVSEVSLSQAVLMSIQSDLLTLDRHDILGHGPTDGHYELRVLYDDGSIQADLDAIYGPGVVQVFSAMHG